MNMKPHETALLDSIGDILVDEKHFANGVCLTGLNTKWGPVQMSVEDAFEDATALINQAIGVFDQQDDFPLDQWGAMQQLYMVRALLGAVHSTLLDFAVTPRLK
jgi:hypothetical protein